MSQDKHGTAETERKRMNANAMEVLLHKKEKTLHRIFGTRNVARNPRTTVECKSTYPILHFWTYTTRLWVRIGTQTTEAVIKDCEQRVCGHMNVNDGGPAYQDILAEFLILCEVPLTDLRPSHVQYPEFYSKADLHGNDLY